MMNSIQREIASRSKEKIQGKEAADRMGFLAGMFMIIGLIVWGMNLVINF